MWEVFTEGIAILITLSFIYCIFGVFADERNSGGKYFPVVTGTNYILYSTSLDIIYTASAAGKTL